jgi:acetoin utilization deacetylase AcuC-like enzyme
MISAIYSPEFLEHDTGYGHPEKATRLTAIVRALQQVAWQDCIEWQLPTPAVQKDVLTYVRAVHTTEHIERIERIANNKGGYLDADTPVSERSYEVALLAVSAWLDGVDRVLNHQPTFVLARPPGHHATRDRAMGFCLFSNAAIAAEYALTKPNVKRVGILDWDVHHGNGTEAIVRSNPQIAYCSIHQHPCYPGTGSEHIGDGERKILNLPMKAGSNIADYRLVFEGEVMPFFLDWQPDILIVSAGYDANNRDPLADISLDPEDYNLLTKFMFN